MFWFVFGCCFELLGWNTVNSRSAGSVVTKSEIPGKLQKWRKRRKHKTAKTKRRINCVWWGKYRGLWGRGGTHAIVIEHDLARQQCRDGAIGGVVAAQSAFYNDDTTCYHNINSHHPRVAQGKRLTGQPEVAECRTFSVRDSTVDQSTARDYRVICARKQKNAALHTRVRNSICVINLAR